MKKSARKNTRSPQAPARLTARTADKHILYQKSVQAPEYEVQLLTKLYKKAYGKKALTMREDFCGTAILCAAWAKSDKERSATGVDLF
jgi:hypothetical protein